MSVLSEPDGIFTVKGQRTAVKAFLGGHCVFTLLTITSRSCILRLRGWAGFSGTVLDWVSAYLSDRSLSVATGPFMSAALCCGGPQFSLGSDSIHASSCIISSLKGILCRCYADDIQLYFSLKPNQMDHFNVLYDSVCIKERMAIMLFS